MYRVAEGLVPAIPSDHFPEPHKQSRRIRAPKHLADYITTSVVDNYIRNNSRTFEVPESNTDQHKHSFFPRTIKAWNRLDDSIVNSPSVNSFKCALETLRRK